MAKIAVPRSAPAAINTLVIVVLIGMNFYKTIPPGRVGVATLFGNVQPDEYTQGAAHSGEPAVSLDPV